MRLRPDVIRGILCRTISKHAPIVCGGVGMILIGAGVYYAVKETDASVEKRKTLKKGESKPIDYLKVLVPSYKKTIVFTSLGFSFIGTGIGISTSRLSGALVRESLRENTMLVAKKAVYDVVGEEATSKIEQKIGEYYKDIPDVDKNVYGINHYGEGSVLFEDGIMGGLWRSTIFEVKDGFNEANSILNDEEELIFNGFLECFPGRDYIENGENIGFSKKKDNKFKIEILPSSDPKTWDTGVSKATGEPCYILRYTKPWELDSYEFD